MKDNMELWKRVYESNPHQLKKVTMRGGFISIDAYSQIESMTKEFGPMGQLWMAIPHACEDKPPEGMFMVKMELKWRHTLESEWNSIFQFGCAEWKTSRKDTPKIAMTDGLTKCISYLGFNGDVFNGEWDNRDIGAEQDKATKPLTEEDSKKMAALVKEFEELAGLVRDEERAKGARAFVEKNNTLAGYGKAVESLKKIVREQ